MPRKRSRTPRWHPPTLQKKRADHQACFADIFGVPLAAFPPGKFELLSEECYETHWLAYQADCRHNDTREYVGPRHYFVDHMLGVAVTTCDESYFVTYFHEDFDQAHGVRPARGASAGQRELEYRKQLDLDQKTTKLQAMKLLRNR
jgi:hypothetical protein